MFARVPGKVSLLILVLASACHSQASAAKLEGLVVTSDRKPLGSSTVHLVVDRPHYYFADEIEPVAKTVSGSDGRFSLDVPETTQPVALIASSPGYRRAKFPVQLDAAQKRQLGLTLQEGTPIKGKISGPGGKPLAGVELGPLRATLDSDPDSALRILPQWTTSNSQGEYEFDPVLPNVALQFMARAEGYELSNVQLKQGETTADFAMREGGSTVGGEVFSRGRAQNAFAGIPVRLNGNGMDLFARCDAQSTFQFKAVPPGTFSAEAMPDTSRASMVKVLNFPDDNGTSIGLEVSGGYYVSGLTVEAETSVPIGGVGLKLNDTITTSGPDGSFRAGPFYQAAQYVPEVLEESGFRNAQLEQAMDIPYSDGFSNVENLSIRVRLKRLVDVELKNFGQTTSPVTISLIGLGSKSARKQVTSDTATIEVYESGDYVAHAVSGGLTSEATTISVGSVPALVELELKNAGSIRGEIIRSGDTASTKPLSYHVRLLSMDHPTSAALISETAPTSKGSFSFPRLPRGQFIAELTNKTNNRRIVLPVTVNAGETADLKFEMEAGKQFAGTVMDDKNKIVPSVSLFYRLPDGTTGRTESGADGKFLVEDLQSSGITMLLAEHYGFLPYRQNDITLPQENYSVTLKRDSLLKVKVETSEQSRWTIYLMRSRPWGSGNYSEQYLSDSMGISEADSNESVNLAVPGAGRYRIVALNSGKVLGVSEAFDWVPGGGTDKEIVIKPGATGTISGSVEAAPDGVEIVATNTTLPEGQVSAEFKTASAAGKYQITDLPPGDYLILATGGSYSAAALNVDLHSGENRRVDLHALEAVSISGVITLGGEAAVGADVELISQTDPGFKARNVKTTAQGAFVFNDVLPDAYLVRASQSSTQGKLSAQRSVSVNREGAPAAVRIDLIPPKTMALTFPPEANLPAGSDVTLLNLETRETVRGTWNNGLFEAPVIPGDYEVWNGDAVVGNIAVDSQGKTTFGKKK